MIARCLAFLLLLSTGPAFAVSPGDGQASQFIDQLAQDTLVTVEDESLSEGQRRARFEALLEGAFDLNYIGRFVTGFYWRTATPEQQEAYMPLFRDYVVDMISARLEDFDGQIFKAVSEEPVGKRDIGVNAVIEQPGNAPPFNMVWRVRPSDAGLKVLSVKIEGIDMVITQREDFMAILQRDGFDGLLEVLREKAPTQGMQGSLGG